MKRIRRIRAFLHRRRESVKAWGQRNPFLAALAVFTVVLVPALLRLEFVADEAHQAALDAQRGNADLELLIQAENAEEAGELEEACQLRNSFQLGVRSTFDAQFLALRQIVDPEDLAAVQLLEQAVETANPPSLDRDCDGDGQLTDADYFP